MTFKRCATAVLLSLFFLCGVAVAEPADAAGGKLAVRTFQFKHKDADKAAAIIKPLISAQGSMSIQPSSNSLVVTDHPDNLKSVATTLAEFDAPARNIKLEVRLVSAAREKEGRIPAQLRDVSESLATLRFNSYESLGEADVTGKEGEPGLIDLESGYRADFKFGEYDPASETIKLNDFRLFKQQNDELVQIYKASLNLKIGRTVIVGTSKPQGNRALMIVVVARRP